MDKQEILKESQRWLDIISAPALSDEQKAKIIADTIDNFSFYYNRGYLDYRKSVVEMRESPALEWDGQGSIFQDIMGRASSTASAGTASTAPASGTRRS